MAIPNHAAETEKTERETILDAARNILIQRDYGRFSMRGVAAEAKCSPDTVYSHFKSEQLLLDHVVEEALDALLGILQEIEDTSHPLRSLRRMLRAYVYFGLQHPQHYRVAYINRPPGRSVTYQDRPHACYDLLCDSVRACVDQDLFTSFDIDMTSQLLWTTIHGVTSALIVMPKFPWVDHEQLIDHVVDTVIEGLRHASP